MSLFPFPFLFSFEFIERFGYMTKVLDKSVVEVCKPSEAFHFFYLGRGLLFHNCFYFVLLYLYFSSPNYYFWDRNFFGIKITL